MINRNCLTLFLSTTLTLTGWAQSDMSSSSAKTAAASQSASDREPLQEPRPSNFWDGDDPNLVNLVLHPFANKKYVLRHTQPIRDRLNELDQLTAENSGKIKDVDARATQGIQLASEKVSLADQHSSDALNKAQLAQTAATEASTHVSTAEQSVTSLDQYKGSGQTEIRFRPGQSVLSKSAKDALDQMAGPLANQRSYIIEIRGFSSGHGQTAIANSQKMADSVVRYLVHTHNIPVYRIYATGLGNVVVTGEGTASRPASGGRVEVSVLQSGMASTAQR
jgi:outer membrane protein OmpA-like peptidoglycan-associated protein